jgi:hypothetical protein
MTLGSQVDEAVANPAAGTMLAADLAAGIANISYSATVTFTLYNRVVLPADGFVFWLRADAWNPGSAFNAFAYNTAAYNNPPIVGTPAQTMDVPGSLHHTTLNNQDEAESFSLQRFVFTTTQPVDVLNAIAPDQLWIADAGPGLRLAFSSRTGFYKQANVYHYHGDALYPALATQVIDDPSQLFSTLPILSNSLPIWLAIGAPFPLFPSYLVPDNQPPPYGAVHIGDEDTTPLQSAAWHDATGSRWQQAKDRVRVTTYGVRNDAIMDWLDQINLYTLRNPSVIGVMNSPIPRDAKRGQTEFSVLAQKKVIDFEVDYWQRRSRDQARQLIRQALCQVFENFPSNIAA